MKLLRRTVERPTTADTDILDLTEEMAAAVEESGVAEGTVTVFTPGATAGVTTIEYESGCLNDLRRAFELLAPRDGDYEHNLRWGDGNGYSHVRAALLGPPSRSPSSKAAPSSAPGNRSSSATSTTARGAERSWSRCRGRR